MPEQTHSRIPGSAGVVSRKESGWCVPSVFTWMGSAILMGMYQVSSTSTVLPFGESLLPGLFAPFLARSRLAFSSSDKLFVSTAASLTLWSVSQYQPFSSLPSWCSEQQVLLLIPADLWPSQLFSLKIKPLEGVCVNANRLLVCPPRWCKRLVCACVMCHSDVSFISLSWVFHYAALPGVCTAPISVLGFFSYSTQTHVLASPDRWTYNWYLCLKTVNVVAQ